MPARRGELSPGSRLSDDAGLTNAALDLLQNGAQKGRYAFTYVDSIGVIERHRFAEVAHEATLWADLLRRHGVPRGGRVLVLADRDRHWRTALLGIVEAGGVAVPCPAAAPPAVIRTLTAESAGIVCTSPRTDLLESAGVPVLSPEDLEFGQRSTPRSALEPMSPHDFALILHESNGSRFRGAAYTHETLNDQASSGASRLGVSEGERMWCTIQEGSAPSLWLTLAAWHLGVELVVVEEELDPGTKLELLDRLRPAAVWFSDEEYSELARAPIAWVDLSSIRQVMTSGEPGEGAIAFQEVYGLTVAPAPVVMEAFAAAALPAEGDQAIRDAETPSAGLSEAQKGASEDVGQRPVSGRWRAEIGRRVNEFAAAEAQRRAGAAGARAEERRRAEEAKQHEEERARNEKEARRREEQQARERRKTEEQLRKKEATLRKLAEQTARAEERRRDEEAKRLAKEEQQRQERQDKERQQEDERRRNEEAKQQKLAAQAARDD